MKPNPYNKGRKDVIDEMIKFHEKEIINIEISELLCNRLKFKASLSGMRNANQRSIKKLTVKLNKLKETVWQL